MVQISLFEQISSCQLHDWLVYRFVILVRIRLKLSEVDLLVVSKIEFADVLVDWLDHHGASGLGLVACYSLELAWLKADVVCLVSSFISIRVLHLCV